MKISPARTAAFDVLSRIETERAFSSILLPEYEAGLSPPDRGLCHQLTLGVLRTKFLLDRLIDQMTGGRKLDASVRTSLRLGLYQLRFLDRIPSHSAVNESVNLVQRARKTSAKSFVNAILRRAAREPAIPAFRDRLDRLSTETSHPKWLLEKWIGDHGSDMATAIATANNDQAAVAFRFTAKAKDRKPLAGSRPSESVEGGFLVETLTAEIADAADRGEIYFQDEGSQLVGKCIHLDSGGAFLDVCAAPGSKATLVASTVEAGATVVAGELHEHRAKFLLENCRRQWLERVNVVRYDAEKPLPFADGVFDRVLVDAPCSGTGTIRNNPEIRYFLEPEDIGELSGKQLRILTNASKLVKRGSLLLYSTCSLEPEENERVVKEFLSGTSEFAVEAPKVPEDFVTNDGFARTFPQRDNMDGFFIAALRRRRL